MTNSFDARLFEKANISFENIAMRSNSGVSNFGFKYPKTSDLFSNKNTDIIETDDDLWDKQIKADFLSGKFNQLIKKARKEFTQGKAIEI